MGFKVRAQAFKCVEFMLHRVTVSGNLVRLLEPRVSGALRLEVRRSTKGTDECPPQRLTVI